MKHILLIRLSALGDVAMLVPVVKALASQYADLKISVLSTPVMRQVFEEISPNVHFICFDKRGRHKDFKGLNRLYAELSREKFDAVVDCHNVLRTKYLRLRFRLSGKSVTCINKHRGGKRALARQKDKVLVQQPTAFENYAEAIRKIKGLADFHLPAEQDRQPAAKARTHKIGVAPFAAHKGKIYPLNKMYGVVRMFVDAGEKVYLFGAGSEELAVFKQWQKTCPSVVIAAEQAKGIDKEIALMADLDTMISMDSSNQHLAAIAGTRVVSIWGATHPYAGFLAWGQKASDCIQKNLPCRPCSIYGSKKCSHNNTYDCINSISPEEIVHKALS